MRVILLLLSFMGMYLPAQMYFICNEPELPARPEKYPNPIDNQIKKMFTIELTAQGTYSPSTPINVTLRSTNSSVWISEVIMVARTPCDSCSIQTPLGSWRAVSDMGTTSQCTSDSQEDAIIYQKENANSFQTFVGTWMAPLGQVSEIEFSAAVITVGDEVYHRINSPILSKSDVHTDPKEEEDKPQQGTDEVEGGEQTETDGDSDGTGEDANEPEVVEKQEEEETLSHDSDHDMQREQDMKEKLQEKRRQEIADELAESEKDWAREQYEKLLEERLEVEEEMRQFEIHMAEEEKARMDMIQWEIHDKEEHDRIMWEKEQEEEKNRTPKKDGEIDINEVIIIKESESDCGKATCGSSAITSSIVLIMLTAILRKIL